MILELNNMSAQFEIPTLRTDRRATDNSTYKKLAVQWLYEALCFVSSFVVADSFVLRNRQLLVPANRYLQPVRTLQTLNFERIDIYKIIKCRQTKFLN